MKKMSRRDKLVAICALGSIAVGGLLAPATAVTSTTTASIIQESAPTSLQLAQTPTPTIAPESAPAPAVAPESGLVGQCRAAKQRIFVYTERSTTSKTIRTLATKEQVRLADNGSGGFIAIDSPVKGYVQAKDLTQCPGQPKPDPTSSLCRVVAYRGAEGLAIRQRPENNSPRVAGVFFGNRLTLRTASFTKDSNGRTWFELTAPAAGWVTGGPNGQTGNLGACPS